MDGISLNTNNMDLARDELLKSLKDVGLQNETRFGDLGLVVDILKVLVDDDETVKTTEEYPSPPEGMMAMMIPQTFLHINVKTGTLAITAFLIDLYGTMGLATFSVGALGQMKSFLAMLSPENGEYCTYYVIESMKGMGKLAEPKGAHSYTFNQNCLHEHNNCNHMKDRICRASEDAIHLNFETLENKNVTSKIGEGWEVSF